MAVKNKIRELYKSEFIRNFSVLFSGNVAGQAISLLIYPILTRLYSQEDFGLFSLFMSIVGLLTIISTGRYEEALVITKNRKETSLLFGFSSKLLLTTSAFFFVLLFFLKDILHNFFNVREVSEFWYIIPVGVFLTGFYYLLTNLAVRHKDFKKIASANLSLNGVGSAFKFLFGKLSIGGIGLITSTLIGQLTACLSFYRYRKFIFRSFRNDPVSERRTGMLYKDFPAYNMSRTLVSYLSSNAPILLLIGTFGEANVGLFSLAITVLFRPANLISSSLYSVFFEKTASLKKENKPVLPILKQYWQKTAFVLIPCFIIAYIFAPPLFGFIFGRSWESSATFFRFLIPWAFMEFFATTIAFIPVIFKKQNKAFWLETIGLIMRISALYTGIYFNSFETAVFLFSITTAFYMICKFIWFVSVLRKYERERK